MMVSLFSLNASALNNVNGSCCVWIATEDESGNIDTVYHHHYEVADPENCDAFAQDIACAMFC